MRSHDKVLKKFEFKEKYFEEKYEMTFESFERLVIEITCSGLWRDEELRNLLEDYRMWREIRKKRSFL